MRKNFFGSIVLAAALAGGAFIAVSQTASAAVLAHQVKTQGELGSVFINPYDVAPLTAVIDRAGKDIKDIHVRVLGKPNGGIDIAYNVSEHTLLNHDGVPIWGLYPDYLNEVEVSYVFNGEKKVEKYKIYAQPIVTYSRDYTAVLRDRSWLGRSTCASGTQAGRHSSATWSGMMRAACTGGLRTSPSC